MCSCVKRTRIELQWMATWCDLTHNAFLMNPINWFGVTNIFPGTSRTDGSLPSRITSRIALSFVWEGSMDRLRVPKSMRWKCFHNCEPRWHSTRRIIFLMRTNLVSRTVNLPSGPCQVHQCLNIWNTRLVSPSLNVSIAMYLIDFRWWLSVHSGRPEDSERIQATPWYLTPHQQKGFHYREIVDSGQETRAHLGLSFAGPLFENTSSGSTWTIKQWRYIYFYNKSTENWGYGNGQAYSKQLSLIILVINKLFLDIGIPFIRAFWSLLRKRMIL